MKLCNRILFRYLQVLPKVQNGKHENGFMMIVNYHHWLTEQLVRFSTIKLIYSYAVTRQTFMTEILKEKKTSVFMLIYHLSEWKPF